MRTKKKSGHTDSLGIKGFFRVQVQEDGEVLGDSG